MRFTRSERIPALLLVAAVLSASVRAWGRPPISASARDAAASTPVGSDYSVGEGCQLHAYTGAVPLDQLPNYFPGAPDLRGGMTCKFRINAELPLFAFHLAGQADNSLGSILITDAATGTVVQTIENSTDPGQIMPAAVTDVLAVVDADFDGYNDLRILNNCGATGNCSYDFYLYDPKSHQFAHNEFLSSLTTPSFDSTKKQVTTSSNSSAADWERDTYQFKDGRYTLMRQEQSVWDRDKKSVTENTYELRDGKMQLTDSSTRPE